MNISYFLNQNFAIEFIVEVFLNCSLLFTKAETLLYQSNDYIITLSLL